MAAQNRFSETLSRADEILAERTKREIARLKAEDAAAEVEATEQARADSFRRQEIASKYQSAFGAFGEAVPMPAADELPGRFRMRLYETLRRRLPPSNQWSNVRADELPADARSVVEKSIIEAATAEGLSPSMSSLPPDREVVRHRIDETTGARSTEYFSRESFIKGLGRPGRLVERILNPRTGMVLLGPPVSRVEVGGHYAPY